MTGSSHVKHCAIRVPSSEDQARYSDVRETAVGTDELYSTTESMLAVAQAQWTYFLLGCAILLPFNALFNAMSFFLSKLAGSTFYPTFSSYLSSVYTWTKLICQFYCTFTAKQSSPSHRIFASMIMIIFLVSSLCFSTFVRDTPSTFFAFVLLNAVFMAVAASHLCTAVYASAAFLGPSFLRSVLSGQAAIAVVVSAVQVASSIIALWYSPSKPNSIRTTVSNNQAEEIAARIFFGVSAVFLAVALTAYTCLARQPFYRSVTITLEQHRREVRVSDERTELVHRDHMDPSTESYSHVCQVFKRNIIFMFSIAYVFIVTLAVFPAISARVRPVNPGIHPLLFTAVHFLIINSGGFIGQYSCSFPRLVVWSGKKILAMSLLRTVFIPLFLLCNVERPATTSTLPIIHSDVFFMVIVLVMGYSNGYVLTLALLAVSSLKHNPRLEGRREDVDIAATLGSSCMILGLALGSLSSFGVQAIV